MLSPAWLRRTGPILLIALLTGFAFHNRFIQDDAFISFRYAEHLASGHGLVWNYGEPVEGYTNFLWTVLIAGAIRLGIEPGWASMFLGLASFATSLVLTWLLTKRLTGSPRTAAAAVAILGLNYSFSAYATGGLETQFHTALVLGLITCVISAAQADRISRAAWGASFLFTAAMLTRLDTAIAALPIVIGWAIILHRRGLVSWQIARLAAVLGVLPLIVLGSWAAWKLQYYGSLLPNTFVAKVSGAEPAYFNGLYYLYSFVISNLGWPLIAIAGLTLFWRAGRHRGESAMLAGVIMMWLAYVVAVGGDVMEFRFLVLVLPLIAVFSAIALCQARSAAQAVLLSALLIIGNLHHGLLFPETLVNYAGIAPIRGLHGQLYDPVSNWAGVGRTLGEAFGHDHEAAVIATTTAGAVPFYSKLRTVDLIGLNDPWIARHGAALSNRSGHRRRATADYLQARGVNLVIDTPVVVCRDGFTRSKVNRRAVAIRKRLGTLLPPWDRATGARVLMTNLTWPNPPRPDLELLEIPLDGNCDLLAIYLVHSARVNSVIQQAGWRRTRYADIAG